VCHSLVNFISRSSLLFTHQIIGIQLRDLVHVSEAYGPTVTTPAAIGELVGQTEINLRKCCKLVEIMDSTLRHQKQSYDMHGLPRVLAFIESRLQRHHRDDEWFDKRCKEIQAQEAEVSSSNTS
jgi:hypothetical protein